MFHSYRNPSAPASARVMLSDAEVSMPSVPRRDSTGAGSDDHSLTALSAFKPCDAGVLVSILAGLEMVREALAKLETLAVQ